MTKTQFKILIRDTRMEQKKRVRIRVNMTLEEVEQAIKDVFRSKIELEKTMSNSR